MENNRCPKCGSPVQAGMAFCPSCGTPVNGSAQPPMPNPSFPQQNIYVQQAPVKKSNGLGTAGFVLSLVALLMCWVPYLNFLLWLLGLIFSFIGVFKAPRGLAIAGLIISSIQIIVTITIFGAILAAFA